MKKILLVLFFWSLNSTLNAQTYIGIRNIDEYNSMIPQLQEQFKLSESQLNEFGSSLFFAENGEVLGYSHKMLKENLSPEQFVDFLVKVLKDIPYLEKTTDSYFSKVKAYADGLDTPLPRACIDYTQTPVDCRYEVSKLLKGYGCKVNSGGSCRANGCEVAIINNSWIKWKQD
jgi:hypothetical protein